jgi:hypothetical protein
VIGLWAWLIVTPCAPGQLCFGVERFTVWESGLAGAGAAAAILALGCAANSDWRRLNLDTARRLQSWLFKDLSSGAAVDGPGAAAG